MLDETDHIPSTNMFIREILKWLDRELGPVSGNRKAPML